MNIPAAVDDYLAELADQRRQSPHTVSNYRRDLKRLHTLAGDADLAGLQVFQIRRFVAQLHAQGLSGRSLGRMLSAWRGFFAWLGQRQLVPANPCDGIRPPKSPRLLPKALSVDEAAALLTPDDDGDPALSARDVAMFELFYSSGLRLAELAALDIDALDGVLHEGEVRVLGKRSKARIVPVGIKAREALAAWAVLREQLAAAFKGAGFTFVTQDLEGYRSGAFDGQTVQKDHVLAEGDVVAGLMPMVAKEVLALCALAAWLPARRAGRSREAAPGRAPQRSPALPRPGRWLADTFSRTAGDKRHPLNPR